MRFVALILFYGLFSLKYHAQIGNRGFGGVPTFTFQNEFNHQDYYIGGSFGVKDYQYRWGAELGMSFRPFKKGVLVESGKNYFHQYLEQKFYIFLDLTKRFKLFQYKDNEIQFVIGAKPGVLLSNYSGTQIDGKPVWVIAPMAGLAYEVFQGFHVRLAYLYLNDQLTNVADSRVNLSITLNLKSDE